MGEIIGITSESVFAFLAFYAYNEQKAEKNKEKSAFMTASYVNKQLERGTIWNRQ